MYGRRRFYPLGALLVVLSYGYGAAVQLRRLLYALRIFRAKKLPLRVISVGNITLGGTGKTPTVVAVARLLSRNGAHPAVLSRGYGRADESLVTVVSDGRSLLADIEAGGDEPVLLGTKLPGVPVVSGRDRYRAGLFTLQVYGPDTVILDDGFQHVRLQRDLDIVLIDATNPFGSGRLFPAGILREPLSALKRAQTVVITRGDAAGDLKELKETIRRKTRARIFTARHRPVDLMDIKTEELMGLSSLMGTPLLAFCGIARPPAFRSLLVSLGADLREMLPYPDHCRYAKSDLAAIFQRAIDVKAAMIVTTEKDAVKLRAFQPDGIWALRIELEVVEKEEWEQVILTGP